MFATNVRALSNWWHKNALTGPGIELVDIDCIATQMEQYEDLLDQVDIYLATGQKKDKEILRSKLLKIYDTRREIYKRRNYSSPIMDDSDA